MGEPLLAAYLQPLLDKLASGPLMNFAIQQGFDSELRKWKSMLRKIKLVLGDAEEKQTNDIEVKRWLHDLLVLAYDVDDVLDDLDCEALQQLNNSPSDPATSSSQLLDMLPLIKITTRFQDIEEQKSDLGLEAKCTVQSSISSKTLGTTCLLDARKIVGREHDVEKILELMGLSETTDAEVHANSGFGMGGSGSGSINKHGKLKDSLGMEAPTVVIPIVGIGGVGKTTLAKCIYNHKIVEKFFDLKVWACVSDTFDILGVTKAILEKVDRDAKDGATKAILEKVDRDAKNLNNLNMLQERLKEKISRQRFLIVLDDIWNEDYKEWQHLFIPLKVGCLRSVVIVTTRNKNVALLTGTTSPYHLDLLKHDECVSIFARHALGAKDFSGHENLKVIGEEIVRRCDGLPLAAETLGGLLRNQDPMKWKEVCDSSLWNSSISKKIIPALGLSYHYLPFQLKRCFVYFSVFPKDYEFEEEELIFLWMAEGFLVEPKVHKQIEDLGHEYFHDLLSRSLLQQSSQNSTKFVMHDLIHDLVQIVGGGVCFRIEDKEDVDVDTVCHLSYPRASLEPNKKFEVLKNTKRLRTLLALPTQLKDDRYFIDQKLLHVLLPQLSHLRVLSLSCYQISELSSSIGDLKHLRYLNLSFTHIKFLPESLCGLYTLQSLILKGCRYLQKLPMKLIALVNLHHLDLSDTPELQELPPHVVDLKSLRKLTKFVVGEDDALRLRELQKLRRLAGSLTIVGLDKVKDVKDAMMINLKDKENVEELTLEWYKDSDEFENGENQLMVLNLLEPHKTLRKLVIKGHGGVTLPNWIGDSSYSKLVELSLISCKRCKSLPSLGQLPLLEELKIEGILEIETIGTELYGEASQPFPSLKTLEFKSMPKWVNWSLPVGITSLLHLRIRNCPELVVPILSMFPSLQELWFTYVKNISNGLHCPTSLTMLHIDNCKNLRTLPDGIIGNNSNLQVLGIWDCESLASFPSGVLPSTLKQLCIGNCRKLESISEMLLGPTSLDYLLFDKYPNLRSLPECVCTNLTSLLIFECKNLKYLPSNLQKLTSLRNLQVVACDNLVSLPEEGLPPNVKLLHFGDCEAVEKKMWDEWALHKLSSVTYLSISGGFSDEVCFPFPAQESQSLLPPTLNRLGIRRLSNLESLSSSGFRNLTSLGHLYISNCPKLRSLPIEALPPSLFSLRIEMCPELQPKCEEGGEYWTRLSLLPLLEIDGEVIS